MTRCFHIYSQQVVWKVSNWHHHSTPLFCGVCLFWNRRRSFAPFTSQVQKMQQYVKRAEMNMERLDGNSMISVFDFTVLCKCKLHFQTWATPVNLKKKIGKSYVDKYSSPWKGFFFLNLSPMTTNLLILSTLVLWIQLSPLNISLFHVCWRAVCLKGSWNSWVAYVSFGLMLPSHRFRFPGMRPPERICCSVG